MTRLSDRFGRRPVILIGTAGLAISTMLFGLATNFKWMLIFRVLGESFRVARWQVGTHIFLSWPFFWERSGRPNHLD